MVVGMFEVAGEHLHHTGVEPALPVRELAPVLHVRIMT
jgi:hypothetical protein